MIDIKQTDAFMIYLGIFLLIVISLWVYQAATKVFYQYSQCKNIFTCEYCGADYLLDSSKQISKCPECKSYNEE